MKCNVMLLISDTCHGLGYSSYEFLAIASDFVAHYIIDIQGIVIDYWKRLSKKPRKVTPADSGVLNVKVS